MDSDQSQQLALVLEEQQRRDESQTLARDIVADIQNTLLFQLKWEDLLMAAPVALSSLGAIFVAASSTDISIELSPPTTGFKYLIYPRLHPNLLECGEMGRRAFMDSERCMGEISQRAGATSTLVRDIIGLLLDENAMSELNPRMMQLQKAVNGCQRSAEEVYQSFDRWLCYASEIYTACSNTQGANEEALTRAKLEKEKAAVSIKSNEASLKVAQETNEMMKSAAKETTDAFKKASDAYPSGWDLLGQQIVSDLAGALQGLLASKMSQSTGQPNSSENKAGRGTPAPIDPGVAQVTSDMTYYEILDTVLNKGKDGGIDWQSASGTSGSNAITFVAEMLASSLAKFQPNDGQLGKDYRSALVAVSKIAEELAAEVKKSSNISYTPPSNGDSRVQTWKSSFSTHYSKVIELNTAAKSSTGSARYPAKVVAESDETPKQPQTGTYAQTALEGAKNRLTSTQEAMLKSSQNYIESTKLVTETQAALDAVKGRLIDLSSSVLTLTEIKKILISCISLMINLQDAISKLCRWFSALSSCIKFIAEYQVDPFLQQLKRVSGDPYQPKIGKITLLDFQRTSIYNGALTIRAYFGVFSDIANMWIQMGNENIFPGLKMIQELAIQQNEFSKDNANILKSKCATLNRWSDGASKNIRQLASQKQQSIQEDMQRRVDALAQTTKRLPPSAPVKKAIENGAAQAQQQQAAANAEVRKTSTRNLNLAGGI